MIRIRLFPALLAAAVLAAAQTNPRTSAADREAGANIFRSHCASCHGVNGSGGSGPSLATGVFYHGSSDTELYRNISEGIPGTAMPDQFFSGVQIWQIVTYVRSLSAAPVRVKLPGDAASGARLFASKGCSGCHLVRGEGGTKGPDLSFLGSRRAPAHIRQSIADPNAEVSPAYWVARIVTKDGRSRSGFLLNQDTYAVQILDFEDGLRTLQRTEFKDFGVSRTSIMPSYQTSLTPSELDDLTGYLASLERPRTDLPGPPDAAPAAASKQGKPKKEKK